MVADSLIEEGALGIRSKQCANELGRYRQELVDRVVHELDLENSFPWVVPDASNRARRDRLPFQRVPSHDSILTEYC